MRYPQRVRSDLEIINLCEEKAKVSIVILNAVKNQSMGNCAKRTDSSLRSE